MHAQLTSRHCMGWGGVGMLTFLLTCVTCTTDVTSLGWGGVGMLTFLLTCVTCTNIHADGNRAWKVEAKKAGFRFSSVSHRRMQFVKKVPRKRLFTGTQLLDSFWKILKQFVVSNLRTRGKFDRRVDRRLLDQIKAFMYRHNAGHNLWKELGQLAKKSRR